MKNQSRSDSWQRVVGILAVIVATMTTLPGCSLLGDLFDDDSYEGIVSIGFEVISFSPCEGSEQWWMTGSDEMVELQNRYDDLVEFPYEPVFAKLKGYPSGRGEYGHLGAYQREFEISEVVEVRLPEEGECGLAATD